MRYAALDIGSNTFLLTIGEKKENGSWAVLSDQIEYVRLGQDLEKSKNFHPEALLRAEKAFASFSNKCVQYNVKKIIALATSAARDAKNSQELISLAKKYGFELQIITGEKEAELTYSGSRFFAQPKGYQWVLDIGGGSTEVILGLEEKIINRCSFDLGCVRLTERWNLSYPVQRDQIEKALCLLNEEFKILFKTFPQIDKANVLAVAGTPVEALRILKHPCFSLEEIEGQKVSLLDLQNLIKIVSNNSPMDLMQTYGTPQGRGDVLLVGLLILVVFLDVTHNDYLTVSRGGIRFGALEFLSRN